MDHTRCNDELINPVAEHKMIIFGQSTFHVVMKITTLVSSSSENIIDSSAYAIPIQRMSGLFDSRTFDADKYSHMVSKYGKMSIDEVNGHPPANVSSSYRTYHRSDYL